MNVLPFAKPAKRERSVAYMQLVRTLPCCATGETGLYLSACGVPYLMEGQIEADHASRNHGANRKGDDSDCIPMCKLHHTQRHNWAGPFRSWTGAQMKAWCQAQIAATRALIQARHAFCTEASA